MPEHNIQINNIQNQINVGGDLSTNDKIVMGDAIKKVADEERTESKRKLERFVFVTALIICANIHLFDYFKDTIPQLVFIALEFVLLLAYSLYLGLKTITFALIEMIPLLNKIGGNN